ncbi:MAG: pyridoxal-phosphate dependent enzyme, partial [Caulobacteraceae bacterium]
GYVACADEILAQAFDLGLSFDAVVVASGSAGTHAGLLVGLEGASAGLPLIGINVRRPRAEQEANVHRLAGGIAELLGLASPPPRQSVEALDEWVGPGYSLPSPEMVEAVRGAARLEGLLLDPVYTGKAMAGLFGLCRQGRFKASDKVLFVHTGGSPALFAYQDILLAS